MIEGWLRRAHPRIRFVGVASPKTLRRNYRGEELYFELLERVGPSRLRRAFIAAGVSARVTGNLVFFIEDQMRLERHQSHDTRTRYRAELANLDPARIARLVDGAIPG